jgi:hypothetical protein
MLSDDAISAVRLSQGRKSLTDEFHCLSGPQAQANQLRKSSQTPAKSTAFESSSGHEMRVEPSVGPTCGRSLTPKGRAVQRGTCTALAQFPTKQGDFGRRASCALCPSVEDCK